MSNPAHDEFDALYQKKKTSSITHPEDSASSSSDNDSTTLHSAGEDEDTFGSSHALGMPAATYHIPRSSDFTANTGPKGVIADARSYELAKKRNLRQTLRAISSSPSPPLFSKNKKPAYDFSREKSASPDVSPEDEEDEFMRMWRANRLDELAHMSHSLRTRRHSPSQRRYGSLVAVDPLGYLDAVEKVPAETVVVVLIYDDEVWSLNSVVAIVNRWLNTHLFLSLSSLPRAIQSKMLFRPLLASMPPPAS